MNIEHKKRSESFCNFSCFRICDGEEETMQKGQKQLSVSQYQKLSLKKVLQVNEKQGESKLKKSISNNKLEKYQNTTNRSNKQKKEIMLFKKKSKIEDQLEEVNQEISRLTIKYEDKIKKLREIREELEHIHLQ